MKTGIIIPCYNEEKRLNVQAFVEFIKSKDDYHICFVNDGSKDNTLEVLNRIKEEDPEKVSVIDMKKNGGKASAVRAGSRYLFNREDIEFIGFIDADLSTDFNDFESLVATLSDNDNLSLVYGSRGGNNDNIQRNAFRKFFSRIIKALVQLILGLPIEDTQCGAKVFRKDIIPVAYNKEFMSKWLFDVEIFIRLKKHFGTTEIMSRIQEQELTRWVHVDDSKLGVKDSLEIPYVLMSIWFSYIVMELFMEEGDTSLATKKEGFTWKKNVQTVIE